MHGRLHSVVRWQDTEVRIWYVIIINWKTKSPQQKIYLVRLGRFDGFIMKENQIGV